jgi:ribosome maturation factor RimP
MASDKKSTVGIVAELVQPIVDQLGLQLWDVRFEKEGSVWYLRVFLDKEEGINIDDCENVSRQLSPILDEVDPIPQSYTLEVSSPGIGRDLRRPQHFEAFMGADVHLRLIRPVEGERDFIGQLTGYGDGKITLLLDDDLEMTVGTDETAFVRLYEEIDMGGLK